MRTHSSRVSSPATSLPARRASGPSPKRRHPPRRARPGAAPAPTSRSRIRAAVHPPGAQRLSDWYGRALELHQNKDNRAAAARLHGRLGSVHGSAGRFDAALREWRAAAAAFRRLGDARAHARALSEVARVQEHSGRAKESVRTCRTALGAAREAGDGRLEAALLLRLADACDRIGDVRTGRKHRRAADELLRIHG